MNRSFVRSTLDDDHKKSAYKITCRSCSKADKIAVSSRSGSLPPEVTAKKFKQRGWAVGRGIGDDTCPSCRVYKSRAANEAVVSTEKLAELTFPKEKPPVSKLDEGPPNSLYVGPTHALEGEIGIGEADRAGWASHSKLGFLVADGSLTRRMASPTKTFIKIEELKKIFGETPPGIIRRNRLPKVKDPAKSVINSGEIKMNFDPKAVPEMTKEDRRIIFGEIDSHYLDESRGYEKDWNDERVAKGLNVPLAWVRGLREDNFGPERGEAIYADIEKFRAIQADADLTVERLRALWKEMDATLEAFSAKRDEIQSESDKIYASMKDIKLKIESFSKSK